MSSRLMMGISHKALIVDDDTELECCLRLDMYEQDGVGGVEIREVL